MHAYVEYIYILGNNFSLVPHRKCPNSHITLSYNFNLLAINLATYMKPAVGCFCRHVAP